MVVLAPNAKQATEHRSRSEQVQHGSAAGGPLVEDLGEESGDDVGAAYGEVAELYPTWGGITSGKRPALYIGVAR